MAYTIQTWHDEPVEDTPISAARLTHIEQGISDAHTLIPLSSVTLLPATSARNTITSTAVGASPLIVKGVSGQTATLQEWQNSSSTILASIAASGLFTVAAQQRIHSDTGLTIYRNDGTTQIAQFGFSTGFQIATTGNSAWTNLGTTAAGTSPLRIFSDTVVRILDVNNSGTIAWGSTGDTTLGRQAAGVLQTNGSISRPFVTSLPGSPVDGQEIIFQADATNGVYWHLRYRAASGSSFKWEALGASAPLTSEITTDESTASTTYVDLTTVGPSITLPLAGDYLITYGGQVYNATASNGTYISPKLGAATAADADGITNVSPTASAILPVWRSIRRNGLAASAVIKVQTRATVGGTAHYFNRTLEIRPIRLG